MLNKEGRNNTKGMKPMYGWKNFIHMAWHGIGHLSPMAKYDLDSTQIQFLSHHHLPPCVDFLHMNRYGAGSC